MPTPSEPHQAIASNEPAEHALDAGYAHLASVFHGDAFDAERRFARDHQARLPKATAGEVSSRGDAPDVSAEAATVVDAGWPIDAIDLHESLMEAEADRVAGRTVGGDDVRARYGLPPSGMR